MTTRFGTYETGASTHLANDLVLSMTNEGKMHNHHLDMARRKYNEQDWVLYIKLYGLPLVRRAGDTMPLRPEDLHQAAILLMEHYAELVDEGQ